MLVFRIVATVIMGFSCSTCLFKNVNFFKEDIYQDKKIVLWTLYGWLWRAFVIVALWVI